MAEAGPGSGLHIVMLAYPGMTQLDLTAPFEVLARLPGARVELAWKSRRKPVVDASGLKILPDAAFGEIAACDVLMVPGGPGQLDLMEDGDTLHFIDRMAEDARYVTSVCTGSLLLGSAGLLKGYRATCHWLSLDQLALLGAIPVAERVVRDRNRITGAGVTSGLDFALAMAAALAGAEEARRIALAIEYDPAPPFPLGRAAAPEAVDAITARTAAFQARRVEAARKAGARLGIAPAP